MATIVTRLIRPTLILTQGEAAQPRPQTRSLALFHKQLAGQVIEHVLDDRLARRDDVGMSGLHRQLAAIGLYRSY